MAKQRLSKFDSKAWYSFHKISAVILPHLGRQLNNHSGITGPEFIVLLTLFDSKLPTLSLNLLAEELGWEISRVSHQITRMQESDLVKKVADKFDARTLAVSLTSKGRKIAETANPLQSAEINHCFSNVLTKEQKDSLIEISGAIDLHMKEHQSILENVKTKVSKERKGKI